MDIREVTEGKEAQTLFEAGPGKVIVYVRGGIAELIYKPENLQVEILDFDNADEGDDRTCDCLHDLTGEPELHSHEVSK